MPWMIPCSLSHICLCPCVCCSTVHYRVRVLSSDLAESWGRATPSQHNISMYVWSVGIFFLASSTDIQYKYGGRPG